MSRSNINLVGNATEGQNVGTGIDVYKGKTVGNILQFKTLSPTGSTISITCDDNNIYFSAATGGGGSISGTPDRVAKFNSGGNGVEDSAIADETGKISLLNNMVVVGDTGNTTIQKIQAPNTTSTLGQSLIIRGGCVEGSTCLDGQLYLDPGRGSTTRFLNIGSCDNDDTIMGIQPSGTQTNIGLFIKSKGTQNLILCGGFGVQLVGPTYALGLDGNATGGLTVISCNDFAISGNQGTGIGVSGKNLTLCGGGGFAASNDGGNLILCGGCSNGGTNGRVQIPNLPAKSSETCGIYIDGSGNLSTGVISGGSTSLWTQGTGVITPTTTTNNVGVANDGCFTWDGGVFMRAYTGATNNPWCVDNGTGECIALSLSGSMIAQVSSLTVTDSGFNNYISIANGGTITGHKDVAILAAGSADATAACDICIKAGQNSSTGLGGCLFVCAGDSTSGTGGNLCLRAGCGSGGAADGRIIMANLPAKSSETCGIYIDASGNLSTGVISGGTGGSATLQDVTDNGCTTTNSVLIGDTPISFTGTSSLGVGQFLTVHGNYSLAAGVGAKAYGLASAAFGGTSEACGDCSFAQGRTTCAIGFYGHSEGWNTKACGDHSHAEGYFTHSCGANSHAEGAVTCALGLYSHAEGECTIASGRSSHASGMYNIGCATTIAEIGVGTSAANRCNAFEVYCTGQLAFPLLTGKTSETCVVYIDANGRLTTGTPASDSRLKCCVEPLTCAVSYLDSICGYSAEFNELSNCAGCCEYVFIAQEIETVLPLAVKGGVIINDVDYKKVEYDQLVPVLWNIVKEQEVRIKALEAQINS